MNREAFESARFERDLVAAEAVGYLQGLYDLDQLPVCHRGSVGDSLARHAAARNKIDAALGKEDEA